MKNLKPSVFLSLSMLFLIMLSNSSAFSQQSSQSKGEALRRDLFGIEKKSFYGMNVEQPAQKKIDSLINTAVVAYNKKPTNDIHNLIVNNFTRLLDEAKSYKMEGRSGHGLMMIGFGSHSSSRLTIVLQSIEKALRKLCPLFPFC